MAEEMGLEECALVSTHHHQPRQAVHPSQGPPICLSSQKELPACFKGQSVPVLEKTNTLWSQGGSSMLGVR